MSTDKDASLLTVSQVAEKLNVSRSSAWRLVHSGELTSLRIGTQRGSPVRIDADELEDFLHGARRKRPAAGAGEPRLPGGTGRLEDE